jgi:hypothetical protein
VALDKHLLSKLNGKIYEWASDYIEWASDYTDWASDYTDWAIFHLYHDENKLHFDEMMMMSTLY